MYRLTTQQGMILLVMSMVTGLMAAYVDGIGALGMTAIASWLAAIAFFGILWWKGPPLKFMFAGAACMNLTFALLYTFGWFVLVI